MIRSLWIHGRFLYEQKDVPKLIKMVELGMAKLGKEAGIIMLSLLKRCTISFKS